MAKSRWRRTEAQLKNLKEKLGQDVFDYTVEKVGHARRVLFLAHPTIDRQRPSLKALEEHVDGVKELTFDKQDALPRGPRSHWQKPGRLASRARPYSNAWS